MEWKKPAAFTGSLVSEGREKKPPAGSDILPEREYAGSNMAAYHCSLLHNAAVSQKGNTGFQAKKIRYPGSRPMNDFTFEKYAVLCKELLTSGYTTMTVKEYLSRRPEKNYAILRHDVDTKPHRALSMAQLERSLGISSTYYFRHTPKIFKPQIIKEVADLGHEIGYHYEVLTKTKGDYAKAITLFKEELDDLQKISPVSTICMHGSPLSPYDNRDLWKKYDFRDYGVVGEAYLSMDPDMYYCSDTGLRWDKKHKVRDHLSGNREFDAKTTDDIILAVRNRQVPSLYLLVHPGNWSTNTPEWIAALGMNLAANTVKSLVSWRRSL